MHNLNALEKRFNQFNQAKQQSLLPDLNKRQHNALRMIPLLLHTNINMMPGFISKDTPCGIAHYTPDDITLSIANRLSKYFSYDPEEEPADSALEAVLIQVGILSGKKILWLIHKPGLNLEAHRLLSAKAVVISKWLHKQGLDVTAILSTPAEIAYNYYSFHNYTYHIDKCFFLDRFHAESILLAGKPFDWWFNQDQNTTLLLPDDNHLQSADLCQPDIKAYTSAAVWHLYNIYNHPVDSCINLSLIENSITTGKHSFFSNSLRETLHGSDTIEQIDIDSLYKDYLSKSISGPILSHIINLNTFHIKQKKSLKTISNTSSLSLFNDYKNALQHIYAASEQLYRRIKTYLNLRGYTYGKTHPAFSSIAHGLLSRLHTGEHKINMFNRLSGFTLDKISYRQQVKDGVNHWSLIHDENILQTSNNLINLTCWAFINRLIDTSTQISINVNEDNIRQIDLLDIIRTLDRNINFDSLHHVDIEEFIDEPMPIKSILFLGHNSDEYRQQVIDHIIFYNTGEIYAHRYQGIHLFYKWYQSYPRQHVIACLYGHWANKFREIDRRILTKVSNLSLF